MANLTLRELQEAQAVVVKEIDRMVQRIADDSGPTPMACLHVYAKEAWERLPELRKTEAMIVARIRAMLEPTT